jgi:PAS domain S-box-containing protein
MDRPENLADENRRLRRGMRDLVALSTLPAVWIGLDPSGIAGSLADVLLTCLAVDFVYIRLRDARGDALVDLVRSNGSAGSTEAVRAAFASLFDAVPAGFPATISGPGGDEIHVARTPVGNHLGFLVTGARRADFPTEQDRLLLNVGANQAAIVIQRCLAEEQVQRQREWLQVTLASIGDAVIATDGAGYVTFLNQVAQELTGWTDSEAQGKPLEMVFHIVHEHTRQPVENPVARVLREGRVVGLANHTVLLARDGSERPIDDSAAPIRDQQGRIGGVVLIFRDVTEQRRREQALRESEARKAAMFNTALDCIITCDQDGRVVEFNPAAERTFGYARADAIGKDLADLIIPPALRNRHRAGMARHLATGEETLLNRRIEFMARRADGSEFPTELAITRIRTDGPPEFTAYLRDISERRRAEEERDRFFAVGTDMLVVAGFDGYFKQVSPAWERVLGWTAQELTTQPWLHFVHPDDRAATEAEARRLFLGEETIWFENRYRTKGGEYRWLSWKARPYLAERLLYSGAIDITERKHIEEQLREADRRKDEFLATLAHELRNPLAPLRNAAQLLKLPQLDSATVERSREIMERQVQHLVRLVDDLLDVSRVMRGKIVLRKESIDLASIVARAVETVQPLIDAQAHTLKIELPSEPLPLEADPVRLTQVVGNLLTNAAKYTEAGGCITLTAVRDGDTAVLRVRDTGIGIAAEMLPKIFDLFIQVEPGASQSQGGLGIGLTLVKNLLAMHQGTIEAASAGLGQGSEFVVRLPLVAAVAPPQEKAIGVEKRPRPPGRRVLVVDDNVDAADSLALMLKMMGNEVHVARDGLAAVEEAAEFRPDLILLDIGMPKLNGYEACRRIRAQPSCRNAVIVALTGWGQEEDRRRSQDAGFNDHLVKPVEPGALQKLLAELPARTA